MKKKHFNWKPFLKGIAAIAIPVALQLAVHYLTGNAIIHEMFGSDYGSGFEYWGSNLALWLGPWGFVICGLIGTYLYNTYWSKNGKIYGYQWYHYVLSVIVSIVASAAWFLVVLAISLAIMLIVGAFIVAIICGMFSGS